MPSSLTYLTDLLVLGQARTLNTTYKDVFSDLNSTGKKR